MNNPSYVAWSQLMLLCCDVEWPCVLDHRGAYGCRSMLGLAHIRLMWLMQSLRLGSANLTLSHVPEAPLVSLIQSINCREGKAFKPVDT